MSDLLKRIFLALEANALGRGGVKLVHEISGVSQTTIIIRGKRKLRKGRQEAVRESTYEEFVAKGLYLLQIIGCIIPICALLFLIRKKGEKMMIDRIAPTTTNLIALPRQLQKKTAV